MTKVTLKASCDFNYGKRQIVFVLCYAFYFDGIPFGISELKAVSFLTSFFILSSYGEVLKASQKGFLTV